MEQAAQLELTIDLEVAWNLGLTIWRSTHILLRADKVFPASGAPARARPCPRSPGRAGTCGPFPGSGSAPGRGDRTGTYRSRRDH